MQRLKQLSATCVAASVVTFCSLAQAQLRGSTTLNATSKRSVLTASESLQASAVLEPWRPDLSPRLALDGSMRFYRSGNGLTDVVQIDVTNQGLLPATETEVAVGLSSYPFTGTLYQYWGGTATTANTVNGGERGFVHIDVWPGVLQECQSYQVSLGLPAQGTILYGSIATQCPLRWTTPITAQRLGATPDPLVAGKTLQDIVSSRVQGSAKGFCSSCHNRDAGLPPYYKPNIARGATTLIGPYDDIGNHIGSPDGTASWAFGGTTPSGGSYYSWAEWFISRNDKPQGLKQVFAKWLADGSLN